MATAPASLLSIPTLPNEITSEIFLHFLPVYPRCPPLTGNLSPTCLTHICRRWREIALTTPALWRAMPFCIDAEPILLARRLDSNIQSLAQQISILPSFH
ncbi:hypothetical protein C8R47DRAFT_177927 [Mycena vitilis]|nr:hypothetical protein C8R47DRAFT_177927 [Mycena vitilis]